MNTNIANSFPVVLENAINIDLVRNALDTYDPNKKNNQLWNIDAGQALITDVNEQLDDYFLDDADIEQLINYRADFFDALLKALWQNFDWDTDQKISLIAVGGYGRGELHPYSDIDILILTSSPITPENQSFVEQFIQYLWDLRLIVGQSVRTISECVDIASKDITVITNLIESRLITGCEKTFESLYLQTNSKHCWPSNEFFRAKKQEQDNRHDQFNDTEYNLEPNIKECPGGLRDIQMVSWIINRHTSLLNINELINLGFLKDNEFDLLINGRNYLWKLRYALHMHYGRAEDRLLFDAQKILAKVFGYEDNQSKLGVEQFMQEYYRWALKLSELNDMLIQLFEENILLNENDLVRKPLNDNFELVHDLLDINDLDIFKKNPSKILEVFVICSQNPSIKGLRADTIRSIKQSLHLIDDAYRADPNNQKLFLTILKSSLHAANQLKQMKRIGVLNAYIPAFGKIMGQTQHDLFHIYTVDAHTILLTLNIQKFHKEKQRESWPLLYEVCQQIENIELLYLAGVFHDIAKGRGGDHSTLGAIDAFEFCRSQGLSRRDSNLVSWLVKKHLLMSSTAQRKDIDDPEVIREFALEVGDQVHLDYLFVLTVADINATNKKLWNAWRGTLMRNLYQRTKRALRHGLEHYLDREEWVAEKQQQALTLLKDECINPEQARKIWDEPNNDYFLREPVSKIVARSLAIEEHKHSKDANKPLITLKHSRSNKLRSASEIFIYTPIKKQHFAVITTVLEKLNLSVQDVNIYATKSGYSLDSYYVLNANNKPLDQSSERRDQIIAALHDALDTPDDYPKIVSRRTPRQLKHFVNPTRTSMHVDTLRECSVLEVLSPDRPGLLARIARIFVEYEVNLINAKIATLGETVEDIFFITDQDGRPIYDEAHCEAIQDAICESLDAKVEEQPVTSISF